MINWRESPFVRLLIPLIAGMLLAYFELMPGLPAFTILLGLLLVLPLSSFFSIPFGWRWAFGLLLNLALLTTGYQLTQQHDSRQNTQHYSRLASPSDYLFGTVSEAPRLRNRLQVILDIEATGVQAQQLKAATGRLAAYLPPTPQAQQLRYGDRLLLSAPIHPPSAPKNPKAFDYRAYLYLQNIHYQIYPDTSQWQLLDRDQGHPVLATALRLRRLALERLHRHLGYGNEYAIVAALVLGDKRHLSEEVRNAYADTGAMHVLAVSGLHVGLIYLALAWLLSRLRLSWRFWAVVKTLLLLLGVWAFALFTGASASVLRAASMFSFIIIGRALQRQSSVYNSLAASAFCLLCFDPYLLFEVGFQLSYLAVTGIVFFQARIYKLWYIENKMGDYLWQLLTVGLAAQLTTFPLSIYYFHQFPLYFWLSGLIVVPAAMLILGTGVLVLLAEGIFPALATLLGKVLLGVTWLSNSLIFLLLKLPGGLIGGLWIGLLSLLLLYLLVVVLMLLVKQRKMRILLAGMVILGLLVGQLSRSNILHQQQQQLTIYSLTGHSLVDYFDGQRGLSLHSSQLTEGKARWVSMNHRMARGIDHLERRPLGQDTVVGERCLLQGPFMQFGETRMVVVDETLRGASVVEPLRTDYLLLCDNPWIAMKDLQRHYNFRQVVFDASNSRKKRKIWAEQCHQLGISYRDLAEEGALIIDLKE